MKARRASGPGRKGSETAAVPTGQRVAIEGIVYLTKVSYNIEYVLRARSPLENLDGGTKQRIDTGGKYLEEIMWNTVGNATVCGRGGYQL